MKKVLLVSNDTQVTDSLTLLINEGRVFVYRLVQSLEALHQILKDENDFFVAIVDTDLEGSQHAEALHYVLSQKIPSIILLNTLEDKKFNELIHLPIVDYALKENSKEIDRALSIAEDLLRYKNKKVLIVHSNKTLELYLVSFFKQLLFETVIAEDIAKAWEILRSDNDIVIVVVSNEHTQIKGSEFVKQIRMDHALASQASNRDLILFGVTSSDNDAVRSAFIKNGANEIFKIPFTKEEFNAKISNTMRLFMQTQELHAQIALIDEYVIYTQTDIYGAITHASPAFEKVSGFEKIELIGKPHSTVSHPDRNGTDFKKLWQTITHGKVWQGEIKNRTKSGKTFWIRTHISPDIKEGTLIGYTAISENITAEKELEALTKELEQRVETALEENKKQSQQIMQQSRLAQMGEMISMIAHQWRQPLTSITTVCANMSFDVVMEQYEKEKFEKHLQNITNIAMHLSSTINDFRSFFKENRELVRTDWKRLIDESLSIIGPSIEDSNITIHQSYDAKMPLQTYPNEIKQVIINILKNAKDILIEKKIGEPCIWISAFDSQDQSTLRIIDNAGGIDADVIDKIFDPYFTTKDEHNGTGLGLYMSKTIIEDHCKGKLSVCNTEMGACFDISIKNLEHEQCA